MKLFSIVFPIVFLLAAPLAAQPVISNVRIFPSANELTVRAEVNGAPVKSITLDYGTTPALGMVPYWAATDYSTWKIPGTNEYELHSNVYFLPTPSTQYYFQVTATWSGGTVTSSCTNGQTGTGWTCQAGGGVPMTTTTAAGIPPAFHEVRAYPSHGSVIIRSIITNFSGMAQSLRLSTGLSNSLGTQTTDVANNNETNRTEWSIPESGLKASTPYYFAVTATTANGTVSSSCTSGQTGFNWTCEPGGGKMIFTTTALPAKHGEPALPITLDTTMPSVNGSTFAVASDCSNLQTRLNACAVANPSLIHQVTIPPEASCRGTYTLPVKTGTGTCIVRSAASDSQLPPPGTRITEAYSNVMPTFVQPITDAHINGQRVLRSEAGTQGWRLVGLRFTLDSPTTHRKIMIAGVANDGTITTATPHGLTYTEQIYIVGVQGFAGRGPNGVWQVYGTPSSTTFNVSASLYNQVGSPNFTGTYTGGGYIVHTVGNAISGVSNATPPVVTTSLEHGLFNEPWSTIVSVSGSTLTLADGHFIDGYTHPVEISGSSVAAYNGIWNRSPVSGNSLMLTDGPASSCAANCGQIRAKRTLHIRGVGGATTVNGNHLFTVVDDTHIKIDDAIAGGAYTSGGVLAFDPGAYYSILGFDVDSSRMVIDRCIFEGAVWPNRIRYGIGLSSSNSAIIDSKIERIKNWRAVNPKTGGVEPSTTGETDATSMAIFLTQGKIKKIHNNFIEQIGIGIFTEQWPLDGPASDITFTRNHLYSSLDDMSGSPTSTGLYYPKRQHFELKEGTRVLIDGNTFDGNWVDHVPCGASLLFTPRAAYSYGYITDITITNNTIKNSGGGIQISSTDEAQRPTWYPASRFKIHNNLMFDIDRRKFYSRPNLTGGGICGYAVVAYGPVEDLQITHNTALDVRGPQAQFFSYAFGRSEGVSVKYNLFTHNQDNGPGALQIGGTVGDLRPTPTGTVKQVWDSVFPVNSEFAQNVVIPGVRDSGLESNYDSKDPNVTISKPDCNTYYTGFKNTCLGSSGANDTARQRLGMVKFYDPVKRNINLRFDSPAKAALQVDGLDAGADIEALESAQGKLRNVRMEPGMNSAKLSYTAPDAAACFIDYGTDATMLIQTRISDGGGAKFRSVSISALNAGTLYYYRLQCAAEPQVQSFVTKRVGP